MHNVNVFVLRNIFTNKICVSKLVSKLLSMFLIEESISKTKGKRGVKYTFSESSLQELSKNIYLVAVVVRVIKLFGTKDKCSSSHMHAHCT